MTVAAPPVPTAQVAPCRKHPDRVAAWQCDSCGKVHCDDCLKTHVPGRVRTESCPECRGYCRKLRIPSADDVPADFLGMLRDAAAYPLRGHGLVLMVLGALFLAFILMLTFSFRMRTSIFFLIFGLGYLAAYMFHIVEASANGKKQLPDWPEFSNFWDSICVPFFQMLCPIVLCALPGCLPVLVLGWDRQSFAMGVAVSIVCSFYVPMAILAIAVNNALAGMHPANVIPAIRAVFPRYAAIWAVIGLLGTASELLYFTVLDAIPFAGAALNMYVVIWLGAMEMRLLGVLYHTSQGKLKLVG